MANTTKNRAAKCVMARLHRNGVPYQKNFGLRKYRTWTAAETAAQRWVTKMKRELGPPTTTLDKQTKRNQSGVVGVFARIDRFESSAGTTDYCRWYARWPGCELKGGVGFSADKFGDDDAFVLACLAREYETVDRVWLAKKLNSFKKTKKCQALLQKKQQEFVSR